MHDVRAGISPEERHRREHPHRGGYFAEDYKPPQYALPRSTSFHSEDQDVLLQYMNPNSTAFDWRRALPFLVQHVLFESPLYPDRPAGRVSNFYDAGPSQYHRKPVAYGQPSSQDKASSSSPRIGLVGQNNIKSTSTPRGLRRTFSDESTRSHDSLSSVDLDEVLEEDYEEYVVVPDNVKVPGRHKKDWLHPFS